MSSGEVVLYEEAEVLRRWHELLGRDPPLFRNNLSDFEIRPLLETEDRFVALFDKTRAQTKRQTLYTQQKEVPRPAVVRPFDPQGFHFVKTNPIELLAMYGGPSAAPTAGLEEWPFHPVLINVSPLAEGHVVLVPDSLKLLPQVLTAGAVRLLVRFAAQGVRRDWRVLFNSLGGWASVNHLHIHGLFTKELFPEQGGAFPIEGASRGEGITVSCHGVEIAVHRLAFPVNAWAIEAVEAHPTAPVASGLVLDVLATAVWLIVERLQLLDVAHHLLATCTHCVYLIPRRVQCVNPSGIRFAVMEVCGTAICGTASGFADLTAAAFADMMRAEVSLSGEEMGEIEEEAFRRLAGGLGAAVGGLRGGGVKGPRAAVIN